MINGKLTELDGLTVIDTNDFRGILAPAKKLSRESLEDILDLLEFSNSRIVKEIETKVREADKKRSWVSGQKIEKSLGFAK
jgi:biotin operon repressor